MNEKNLYFEAPCADGMIRLSYDAVAALVRLAAFEAPGVSEAQALEVMDASWHGNKGVWLCCGETAESCRVRVYMNVLLGESIAETAAAVQQKVIAGLEETTFLKVEAADVYVTGVRFDK